MWAIVVSLGVVAGGAAIGYRPAKRWMAIRHAHELAREAQAAIDNRLWVSSFDKVRAALLFAPSDPEVLRVAARFLALNGQAKAMTYWEQLIDGGHATLDDRCDLARFALRISRLDVAQSEVREMLAISATNRVAQELALELLVATENWPSAERGAEEILSAHPESAIARLVRGQARLRSVDPKVSEAGLRDLKGLAETDGPARLGALRTLAASQQPDSADRLRYAQQLDQTTGALLADRLAAADVRWELEPGTRDSLAQSIPTLLTDQHGDAELAAVADWLRRHQAMDLADSLLPAAGTARSEVLFLARVQLLSEARRWDEAQSLVATSGGSHPADSVACAKAQIAFSRGEVDTAAKLLNSALENAGGRSSRVDFIAGFALQMGQTNIALEGWNRLLEDPRFAFSAALGVLANLPDKSYANFERRACRTLARLQPKDPELQAQNAYFDLLAEENLDRAAAAFQRLAKVHPESPNLGYGLALAALRQNRSEEALRLIDAVKSSGEPPEPHHLAIRAAVLAANHLVREARVMAATIPAGSLRPLELKLVRDLTPLR